MKNNVVRNTLLKTIGKIVNYFWTIFSTIELQQLIQINEHLPVTFLNTVHVGWVYSRQVTLGCKFEKKRKDWLSLETTPNDKDVVWTATSLIEVTRVTQFKWLLKFSSRSYITTSHHLQEG